MSFKLKTLTLLLAALVVVMAAGCGGSDSPTGPKAQYSVITTYAGTGEAAQGGDGLPPSQTALYWPQDISFDAQGNRYIADWNNHRIRMFKDGIGTSIIGTGELGDALDGPGVDTKLNHPTHVSFAPNGDLIMAAWHNSKVMEYNFGTKMIHTICGNGQRSFGGDGGPAEDAILDLPVTTVWDSFNRMYILDQANQRIRVVENGIISTFAGVGPPLGYAGDGGLASEARFSLPVGQAADPAGKMEIDRRNDDIYLADSGNHIVRVILHDEDVPAVGQLPNHLTNTIELFAGTPETAGSEGEGVPATQATFRYPRDVAVGPDGDVFIADTFNHCIRRVDTNGIITTFAGQLGVRGYDGDGGHPSNALLDRPYGVAVDAEGNVFIADTWNHRIRVVWKNPK